MLCPTNFGRFGPETDIAPAFKSVGVVNFNDVIYFAGRRMLARSVPTTVMPVNPLS